MLGLTLEELTDRVMSTVHGEDTEPHVLAALHMLSGCASSQAYLLIFCALARAEPRTTHSNKNKATTPVRLEHVSKIGFGKGTAPAVPSDSANNAALAADGRQVGSRDAFLKHALETLDWICICSYLRLDILEVSSWPHSPEASGELIVQ